MANGVGEWIDSTLSQVIDSYPQYLNYDLYIWDNTVEENELYFLGKVEQVYDQYEHNYVFLTDENEEQVWLEGTIKDFGLEG